MRSHIKVIRRAAVRQRTPLLWGSSLVLTAFHIDSGSETIYFYFPKGDDSDVLNEFYINNVFSVMLEGKDFGQLDFMVYFLAACSKRATDEGYLHS